MAIVDPDAGMDADVDVMPDVEPELDVDPSDTLPDVQIDADNGGRIVVEPSSLAFGEVGLQKTSVQSVTLLNEGTGTLQVLGVGLASGGSSAFDVLHPLDPQLTLAPQASTVWDVRFQPRTIATFSNELVIVSDDPTSSVVRVGLSGSGVGRVPACVYFHPFTASGLGFVPLGESTTVYPTVRNCGTEPITITAFEWQGGTGELTVRVTEGLPRTLEVAGRLSLAVTWTPSSNRPLEARLLVLTDDPDTTAIYEVSGGPTCPTARIVGNVGLSRSVLGLTGSTGELVSLDGTTSHDEAGDELLYRWKLSPPVSSQDLQIVPGLEAPTLTLVPDVAGVYGVSLEVESVASGLLSCEPATFVLDISADPAPIRIELTWAGDADLDLHVNRSDDEGNFEVFGYLGPGQPNVDDVFYDNRGPDFGELGAYWDNPEHSGDARAPGPETVTFAAFEPGHQYKVGVQYALPGTMAVEATLKIVIDGRERVFQKSLTDLARYWVPVIIDGATGDIIEVDRVED